VVVAPPCSERSRTSLGHSMSAHSLGRRFQKGSNSNKRLNRVPVWIPEKPPGSIHSARQDFFSSLLAEPFDMRFPKPTQCRMVRVAPLLSAAPLMRHRGPGDFAGSAAQRSSTALPRRVVAL
jgi:hypothetical protein